MSGKARTRSGTEVDVIEHRKMVAPVVVAGAKRALRRRLRQEGRRAARRGWE